MAMNLNKFYYRDYFTGVRFSLRSDPNKQEVVTDREGIKKIGEQNRKFLEAGNRNYLKEVWKAFDSINPNSETPLINRNFTLEVCYPGVVTGVGIRHEAKIEGEFKLGIHLDYTTGLPVIYGSSVKGVLRSAFREENLMEMLSAVADSGLRMKLDAIRQKLSDESRSLKEWSDLIFGDDVDRDSRSAYCRDIFFDAIVSGVNGNNSFLASDSITQHGTNPLQNPVPITFVRIASGTRITFRFRLVDTGELTVTDKQTLFKAILMTFGVGAKTHVGYGRLKEKADD